VITLYSMIGITVVAIVIIPFLLWVNGLNVFRTGQAKITQQAALAGASQLVTVEDPVTGAQVLRIDEVAARAEAIEYYNTQKGWIRDMFNYPVLGGFGRPTPEANFTTTCEQRDAAGCWGFSVEVQDVYAGTIMSWWIFPNAGAITVGYAEVAANATKCDARNPSSNCAP